MTHMSFRFGVLIFSGTHVQICLGYKLTDLSYLFGVFIVTHRSFRFGVFSDTHVLSVRSIKGRTCSIDSEYLVTHISFSVCGV